MADADIIRGLSAYLEARRELEGGLYLEDSLLESPGQLYCRSEDNFPSLAVFEKDISGCMKCPLGKTRTNFVFGTGNPHADIVFIGEAPGRDEDLQGEPFVGRAGQLLNKMLPQYGLKRSDIYICNILKCRPPGNRDPLPLEIELCEPYLWKQLEIIKPQILVSLGRIAAQTLLKTDAPLAKLRNNMHQYRNTPFFITYHPAALLRNNSLIDSAYQDLAKIKEYYDKVKS